MKKILITLVLFAVTTGAFSQECFQVLPGTRIIRESTGTYTLIINYDNKGNKALDVVVKCGNTQINSTNTCFINDGSGTQVYWGFSCGSGNISAILTPHTGNCGTSSCPSITIYGPAGAPLPVRLSGFSAVRSKQVVALNWNTEFETDAKEFNIERAEGNEFHSIGIIASNVNSTTKKSYSFNDKNDNIGTTYYRLKNVDLNGKFTYSEIRTVKGIGSASDVTIFPNPARSDSKISVVGATANSSIQLLDFSGKVLKNINSNAVNSLDLSGVKNGVYLIRIVDKSTSDVIIKKLTISN